MDITELTTGAIDGAGVFDQMMKSINAQLKYQLDKGRVTNDQYAQVYAQLVTQAMAQAVQYLQTKRQSDLVDAQIALLAQQLITEKAKTQDVVDGVDITGSVGAQVDVLVAQKEGFTNDALQKFMKVYVDVWNVQRTTDNAIAPNEQNKLVDDNIGIAINALATKLNVPIQ